MFRLWPWWLTLILLSLTLGVFWLLGRGVEFSRTGTSVPTKPAASAAK